MYRFVLTCLLMAGLAGFANAQKFGYLNSAVVIESYPGIDSANQKLETYRKSLADPYQAKVTAFQSKYQFYLQEMEAGTLSRITAQTREQELVEEQKALQQEDQKIQFQVLQMREQILQPILTAVDSVIQTVGREGKYTMIFDTSVNGALIYAEESDDLTETVKARLKP